MKILKSFILGFVIAYKSFLFAMGFNPQSQQPIYFPACQNVILNETKPREYISSTSREKYNEDFQKLGLAIGEILKNQLNIGACFIERTLFCLTRGQGQDQQMNLGANSVCPTLSSQEQNAVCQMVDTLVFNKLSRWHQDVRIAAVLLDASSKTLPSAEPSSLWKLREGQGSRGLNLPGAFHSQTQYEPLSQEEQKEAQNVLIQYWDAEHGVIPFFISHLENRLRLAQAKLGQKTGYTSSLWSAKSLQDLQITLDLFKKTRQPTEAAQRVEEAFLIDHREWRQFRAQSFSAWMTQLQLRLWMIYDAFRPAIDLAAFQKLTLANKKTVFEQTWRNNRALYEEVSSQIQNNASQFFEDYPYYVNLTLSQDRYRQLCWAAETRAHEMSWKDNLTKLTLFMSLAAGIFVAGPVLGAEGGQVALNLTGLITGGYQLSEPFVVAAQMEKETQMALFGPANSENREIMYVPRLQGSSGLEVYKTYESAQRMLLTSGGALALFVFPGFYHGIGGPFKLSQALRP